MIPSVPEADNTPAGVRTTCPYCGVGCGVIVQQERSGAVRVEGDPMHPANYGRLCSKGIALGDALGLSGRLLYPEVDGARTTWDVALDKVAREFQAVIAEHGPQAVAFYVSGQCLTEDYYVANKLMKGFIGSANIDTNSRLCMASSVAGHRRAFGEDVVPGCYEDLDQAELIVLVGSNAAWCHPVLHQRIRAAVAAEPSRRVVVIDPRGTASSTSADLHLPLRPGTDAWLFNGLLAYLHAAGRSDREFVEHCTAGVDAALEAARSSAGTVEMVAEHCGLDAAAVETFFRWFAETEAAVTLYSQGINQSSSGTDKVNAILNCHLLTGRIGRPGMGPFSLTGQPNAMGGREVGGLANQLAAHLELDDAGHRAAVQAFWQSPAMPERPGLKAVDLFEAVQRGEVRAIWIMATNPVVSMPDADRVRAALARCPLVVVSDCYRDTDTAELAHVLLPSLGWGEKEGTVTNSERRISRQRAFLQPPAEARADWWQLKEVARRMGWGHAFPYTSAHEVFAEHAALAAGRHGGGVRFNLGGLARLSAEAYRDLQPVQWPVPHGQAEGTARLYGDGRFSTPDGRGRFIPITPRLPENRPPAAFPRVLNTGRIRDQWHTMTRTGHVAALCRHTPEPFAEVHPDDGAAMQLGDGQWVRLESPWGAMVTRVMLNPRMRQGAVFVPMHWTARFSAAGRVGALVNPVVDPISGQPESKHTPVTLAPLAPVWQGMLYTRRMLPPPADTAWVRIRENGYWRTVMAGFTPVEDGRALLQGCLDADTARHESTGEPDWISFQDAVSGRFRFAVVTGGRLQAALCIGLSLETAKAGWWDEAFAARPLTAPQRGRLLSLGLVGRNGGAVDPLVCACNGVTRSAIVNAAARANSSDIAHIGRLTGAGSGCGSCVPELQALLSRAG